MVNQINMAIYVPADADRNKLISQITGSRLLEGIVSLDGLKPAIFSESVLDQYMNEEFLHGWAGFDTGYQRQLHQMSSGERKKAMLHSLLSANPDYFILDAVFDHLDQAYQQILGNQLEELSQQHTIIQLLSRKNELLPFMHYFFYWDGQGLVPCRNAAELFQFAQRSPGQKIQASMPPPMHCYPYESAPLVHMNNLQVTYDERTILRGIHWTISAGEYWQLIGPNGSGKSTLLSMITGDNPKGYGQELYLFGRKKGSGETVWDIKKKIGYFNNSLMQHFSRLDSIEKMIVSGLNDSIGLYIKPTDQQLRLAGEWLRFIGLSALKDKPIQLLPAVHQRMVLIARAMVKHPPLLILDEPTTGLDDASAQMIIQMIGQIATESQTAILFVSHTKEEGLVPDFIFELTPDPLGSTGQVKPFVH